MYWLGNDNHILRTMWNRCEGSSVRSSQGAMRSQQPVLVRGGDSLVLIRGAAARFSYEEVIAWSTVLVRGAVPRSSSGELHNGPRTRSYSTVLVRAGQCLNGKVRLSRSHMVAMRERLQTIQGVVQHVGARFNERKECTFSSAV